MFVTAHTLIAMTVAVETGNPWIFIPAAIVNHLILDLAPHFGPPKDWTKEQKRKNFFLLMPFDAVLGTATFFWVYLKTGFPFLPLFLICVLAGWPDLVSLVHHLDKKRFAKFYKFHHKIQGLQRPYFLPVELAAFALLC
jgi:hypothetical protein